MSYVVKICGMKYAQNIIEIGDLKPDLIGFVLVPTSKRFVDAATVSAIETPIGIRRIGVVADEPVDRVRELATRTRLDGIQLHGSETPEYCKRLRETSPEMLLIKALSGKSPSLPGDAKSFEGICDLLLFDSVANGEGGSGEMFNHSALTQAAIATPFLLSGGLDSSSVKDAAASLRDTALAGFDFNSRLETAPGMKSVSKSKEAIQEVRNVI